MPKENDGNTGKFVRDTIIEQPEIVNALAPTVVFGKKAKVLRRASCSPVPPMIVGIHGISSFGERSREPHVTTGMLGNTMSDLDDGFRS